MRKLLRKKVYIILFFLVIRAAFVSAFAIYRPFDVYRPGARAMGAGATGVSNIDSIGSLGQNPSYLADLTSAALAFGLDAQTRITRLQSDVSISPQYIPVISWGMPIENLGVGVLMQSPFQRLFPGENFIFYTLEAAVAYPLTRRVNVGITAGVALGLQSNRFSAANGTWSVSALYHGDYFQIGFMYRPGASLQYDTFPDGSQIKEKMPDFFKMGLSTYIGVVKIAFELEQNAFTGSSFVRNGKDITPDFEKSILGRINPHIGADFPIFFWPGLIFRTGFFTDDFYDYKGANEKQILWTFGLGGVAGSEFWGDRFKIDFSWASSFLPGLFWKESNNIEKLQVTFEYIF